MLGCVGCEGCGVVRSEHGAAHARDHACDSILDFDSGNSKSITGTILCDSDYMETST
jgi:hypothetical protein